MSETANAFLDDLRRAYLALGKHCHELGELSRRAGGTRGSKLEEVRQKVAAARLTVWAIMEREVMKEWCNETGTPEPFSKYPPKDMPSPPPPPWPGQG